MNYLRNRRNLLHLIYLSNLLGNSTSLSKMQLLIYFPQQWCLILPCPLILMRHLDFSQSVFQHSLICISPINNANEHLSLFLLAICVSSIFLFFLWLVWMFLIDMQTLFIHSEEKFFHWQYVLQIFLLSCDFFFFSYGTIFKNWIMPYEQ